MKLWIARNQNGSLWLHEEKPSLVYDDELRSWSYECGSFLDFYDENIFPEVTFENSPQEVELKLINNKNYNYGKENKHSRNIKRLPK